MPSSDNRNGLYETLNEAIYSTNVKICKLFLQVIDTLLNLYSYLILLK